jgi:hypothetical protein
VAGGSPRECGSRQPGRAWRPLARALFPDENTSIVQSNLGTRGHAPEHESQIASEACKDSRRRRRDGAPTRSREAPILERSDPETYDRILKDSGLTEFDAVELGRAIRQRRKPTVGWDAVLLFRGCNVDCTHQSCRLDATVALSCRNFVSTIS